MKTSSASTTAFRVLVVVLLAAAGGLDVSLARARSAGVVPVKTVTDCDSAAPAAPVPPVRVSDPAAPPGALAAFGSCGDGAASPPMPPSLK